MVFNRHKNFFKKEPRLIRGASLYVENPHGDFLMQLRTADAAREPNKWTALSGAIEPLEDPEKTINREVKEELGITPPQVTFFRDYLWICEDSRYAWYSHNFVFYAFVDLPIETLRLTEGQKLSYLSIEGILKMDLAFNHNQTFRDLIAWLGRQPQ